MNVSLKFLRAMRFSVNQRCTPSIVPLLDSFQTFSKPNAFRKYEKRKIFLTSVLSVLRTSDREDIIAQIRHMPKSYPRSFKRMARSLSSLLVHDMTLTLYKDDAREPSVQKRHQLYSTLLPSLMKCFGAIIQLLTPDLISDVAVFLILRPSSLDARDVERFIEKAIVRLFATLRIDKKPKSDTYDIFESELFESLLPAATETEEERARHATALAKLLIFLCSSNHIALSHVGPSSRIFDVLVRKVCGLQTLSSTQRFYIASAVLVYARTFRFQKNKMYTIKDNQGSIYPIIQVIENFMPEKGLPEITRVQNLIVWPLLFRSLMCASQHRTLSFLQIGAALAQPAILLAIAHMPAYNLLGLTHMLKTSWVNDDKARDAYIKAIWAEFDRFDAEALVHFLLQNQRLHFIEKQEFEKIFAKLSSLKRTFTKDTLLLIVPILYSSEAPSKALVEDLCSQLLEIDPKSIDTLEIIKFLASLPASAKESLELQKYFLLLLIARRSTLRGVISNKDAKKHVASFAKWLKESQSPTAKELIDIMKPYLLRVIDIKL